MFVFKNMLLVSVSCMNYIHIMLSYVKLEQRDVNSAIQSM
jgi:hypothetical protein